MNSGILSQNVYILVIGLRPYSSGMAFSFLLFILDNMGNILENDNSFYTEQGFEINEVNETISIKNIINGQFNKGKTFVLDSISNIMNLFKKTEVKPINKEDLLTVSPEEFKRWKNTPHNIIDTRVNSDGTITLDYLNEVSTSNEGKPYGI